MLAGFALVPLTSWLWLDPALAALVAMNFVWTGVAMVRDSVDALMDKAECASSDHLTLPTSSVLASGSCRCGPVIHGPRYYRSGSTWTCTFHHS